MCNNVSQPFIPLPLHFSPFSIMFPNSCFKCISLLYNAPFSPEIVHLLTSSHFHCFTQPPLTSSSTAFPTLLLHNSLCFWCICLCILLSSAAFFPLFVLSLSVSSLYSPLTVTRLIAAVHFPAFVSLIRVSATLWGKWCERVLHGLSDWVSSQHTKGP